MALMISSKSTFWLASTASWVSRMMSMYFTMVLLGARPPVASSYYRVEWDGPGSTSRRRTLFTTVRRLGSLGVVGTEGTAPFLRVARPFVRSTGSHERIAFHLTPSG